MLLTKQEILDLAEHNMPMFSLKEAQFRICDFAEAIERAVLAKAGEQEPVCEVVQLNQDRYLSLVCIGTAKPKVGDKLYSAPVPATPIPKQEPVGFIDANGDAILSVD